MGFVCGFYLAFAAVIESYATFAKSMSTTVQLLLLNYNFVSLKDANIILGPLFSLLFAFLITIILLNIFLSILIRVFGIIRTDRERQGDDAELLTFLIQKVCV